MTPKTPKYTPNNSQTQVSKKTGGVKKVTSTFKEKVEDRLSDAYESKESVEVLGENFVESRIFFIRHGITEDDEKPENKGKPQKTESKLSKDGREQLEKTAHRLKESGIKPEETLFIYSDDKTVRVQESMGIILEEFGFNLNSPQVEKNEKLNTSEKKETENGPEYHQDEYRLLIDMGVMVETIKLMKEIRTEEKYRKYKNIILVGHKSNKAGITESVTNTDRPIRGDVSIKNGEILESDIGINGRYINYQKNKDLLFVNSYNYKELKEIFPDIPHSSIIEFQNKLNGMFMENKGLFERYIGSENVDLRVFCMVNLLKNNEKINIIENYYKNINKSILEKEEQILWENRKNSNCYNILGLLAKKGLLANPSMKYNFEDYVKILNIQSRSLDEKIKKQESDGILKRNLFLVEKKEIETKDKDGKTEKRIEYTNKSIDISEIILSTSKYILPAHVGNGKSIWLSEFAKKAILDYPEYKIYFFEGSDFNGDNKDINFNKIKELLENQKENTLIFVDAIDEINDSDMKSEIKNLLQQTKNKTIITARLSEYNDKENGGFKTLGFNPISKDEFISSRISDEKIKGEISKTLESSNLSHEIEGNPLLLNFVCILANLDEKEKEKYKEYGIKSLENILNKADLYESVSRLIIYKHNETKGVILSEEELDFAIENLAKNAFNLFKGNKLKISDKQTQKSSIIFKKSENQDEYQFIHNSFYEFFLARHLVNISNGNEEIYKVRDENENNWNKWREFKPVVMFYGEILGNEVKLDKIADLLSEEGLLKNDDIFGEGFFMGLEILFKLEQNGKLDENLFKIKNKYLKEIENWNNIFSIYKLGLFQDFQKNINYYNNSFIDIFIDGVEKCKISKRREEFFKFRGGLLSYKKLLFVEYIKLGDKKNINLYFKKIERLIEEKYSDTALEIYLEIVKISSPYVKEGVIRGIDKFINHEKYHHAGELYMNFYGLPYISNNEKKHSNKITDSLLFKDNSINENICLIRNYLTNNSNLKIGNLDDLINFKFTLQEILLYLIKCDNDSARILAREYYDKYKNELGFYISFVLEFIKVEFTKNKFHNIKEYYEDILIIYDSMNFDSELIHNREMLKFINEVLRLTNFNMEILDVFSPLIERLLFVNNSIPYKDYKNVKEELILKFYLYNTYGDKLLNQKKTPLDKIFSSLEHYNSSDIYGDKLLKEVLLEIAKNGKEKDEVEIIENMKYLLQDIYFNKYKIELLIELINLNKKCYIDLVIYITNLLIMEDNEFNIISNIEYTNIFKQLKKSNFKITEEYIDSHKLT